MMNVNYFGAVYATKAVLDNMKKAKSGSIVFLSSQGGQVGFIGMTGYSPTKYALRGFAESLKNEVSVMEMSSQLKMIQVQANLKDGQNFAHNNTIP